MIGIAARLSSIGSVRFTSSTCLQPSSVISPTGRSRSTPPALLQTMSIPPRATAAATTASMSCWTATSARTGVTPGTSKDCARLAALWSAATTRAPLFEKTMGHRLTNARSRTRDNGDPILQTHRCTSFRTSVSTGLRASVAVSRWRLVNRSFLDGCSALLPNSYTDHVTTTDTDSASSGTAATSSTGRRRSTGARRKLTDDQEREIAQVYGSSKTPVSQISSRFGISESSVYRVAERHGVPLRGRTSGASDSQATAGRGRPSARGAGQTASTRGRRGTVAKTDPAQPAAPPRRRRSPLAAGGSSTAAAASGGKRSKYQITFVGVRTVEAASMRDAIRQAEVLGAREITSITRSN